MDEPWQERLDRIERILESAGKKIDKLGDSLGRFAEGLVAPCVKRELPRFDIEIHGIRPRAEEHIDGETMEVDVVGVGQRRGRDVVVVVEVKTHLRAADVTRWVKQLGRFRDFFREYRAYDLVAGVAGMQIEEGAERHAEREGLFVLGPSGEVVEVRNSDRFRPKVFSAARRPRRK
jgi:hypothetical protein